MSSVLFTHHFHFFTSWISETLSGGSSLPPTASVPSMSMSSAPLSIEALTRSSKRRTRSLGKISTRGITWQILKSPLHGQDQCDLWVNGCSTEEGLCKGQAIVLRQFLKLILQGIRIAEVIIHPDYWSDKTKHGNSYDLALIQMDQVSI